MIEPSERAPNPIDPGASIGHVHLRTADIDRVRKFYVDVLGFDVIFEARDVPGWGTTGDTLFLSAGGYHHHLGFNTWLGEGIAPMPDDVIGLRRWTVLLPAAADVDLVGERLLAADVATSPIERGLEVRDAWRIPLRVEVVPG